MDKTTETHLRKIKREYARTKQAFELHSKKWNCHLDSSGCIERAKFQERLVTLDFAIKTLGGKPYLEISSRVTTITEFMF